MQLRNPSVFKKPKTAKEATAFCDALRANPAWEFGDYEPEVAKPLWNWAAKTTTGFRHIIDARLAFTLRHHGVTHFATANNEKHFEGFGLQKGLESSNSKMMSSPDSASQAVRPSGPTLHDIIRTYDDQRWEKFVTAGQKSKRG